MWKTIILGLVDGLGDEAVQALSEELDRLEKEATAPWKVVTLNVIADLVRRHGIDGLDIARDLIAGIAENKRPDLKDLRLATASDVVAKLQNAEAKDRRMNMLYVQIVVDSLLHVVTQFI